MISYSAIIIKKVERSKFMEEFRGTKGEWLVEDIDVISSETGMAICQVYDGLDTHVSEMDIEVVNSNARLIAAVPELLKALQKIIEFHKAGLHLSDPLIKYAYPAINKALGIKE